MHIVWRLRQVPTLKLRNFLAARVWRARYAFTRNHRGMEATELLPGQ